MQKSLNVYIHLAVAVVTILVSLEPKIVLAQPGALPLLKPADDCAAELYSQEDAMVQLGDLRITWDQKIFWKNREVSLVQNHQQKTRYQNKKSAHLLRVLFTLVDQPNNTLSIREIYQDAWGNEDPFDEHAGKSVPQAILGLRRSFQLVDHNFDQIKTLRGSGYSWETGPTAPNFVADGLTISTHLRKLSWKKKDIELNAGQFKLVWTLIQNFDQTVPFEDLYKAYTRYPLFKKSREEMLHILHVNIDQIRKLFKLVDPKFARIQNIPGVGFVWKPKLVVVK